MGKDDIMFRSISFTVYLSTITAFFAKQSVRVPVDADSYINLNPK